MSGVIKRRGDEGQRGKERWRTEEKEGGTQGKEAMRTERSGNRNELGLYYSRLDITQEHFLLHEMSVLFFFYVSRFISDF